MDERPTLSGDGVTGFVLANLIEVNAVRRYALNENRVSEALEHYWLKDAMQKEEYKQGFARLRISCNIHKYMNN